MDLYARRSKSSIDDPFQWRAKQRLPTDPVPSDFRIALASKAVDLAFQTQRVHDVASIRTQFQARAYLPEPAGLLEDMRLEAVVQ